MGKAKTHRRSSFKKILFRERKSQIGQFFLDRDPFTAGQSLSVLVLPLEHTLGILPMLDLPEQERKEPHALEKNGNAHPETGLLCSDSHCDLGESVIRFHRPGILSSRLPAHKSILRLPIAAKTISQQAGGASVCIPEAPLVFLEQRQGCDFRFTCPHNPSARYRRCWR